jgi:hypothetical protein
MNNGLEVHVPTRKDGSVHFPSWEFLLPHHQEAQVGSHCSWQPRNASLRIEQPEPNRIEHPWWLKRMVTVSNVINHLDEFIVSIPPISPGKPLGMVDPVAVNYHYLVELCDNYRVKTSF